MRALKDHPALAGQSVVELWKKHKAERLAYIEEQRRGYPRAMQRYWRLVAETKAENRRRQQMRPALSRNLQRYCEDIRIPRPIFLSPAEYEKSMCSFPIYPLGYMSK